MLALVCAAAVSTIYGIQPVLEAAGEDLGLGEGALGWLVAAQPDRLSRRAGAAGPAR
ncbi:hypothetical protein ACFSTC_38410 [Nonomuraea ferruginea]